ncbi:MAG: PKD domain-containing protein, partial [Flavisolibacter sp.]
MYSVSLTVSNDVGCSATSYPVSVNAAYFKTDFTDRPLCREVGFTSSSYLYPNNSLWLFGDGSTTNFYSNTSHVYATAGSYNVSLINTYSHCKDTITKTIAVQNLANFNSGITMPASVCLNANTNFTSTSSVPASSMKWNFGDNTGDYTTTWNQTPHIYNQPGNYTVKLVNTFGTCSETVSKDIVVHPLPDPKGFIVDYGGVCGSPVTVSFKDTTPGAVSWQWYVDYQYNNPVSTQQNTSFHFPSDGYHTVYLTVTNAQGCSRSIYKPVNVFRPQASIHHTYSSSPRGHYDCDSLTIKFAVNSNQTIKSYSWNLGNGNTSTLPDPQLTYNKEGIYPITLNYITESGCPGSAIYEVRVYGKPVAKFDYFIPCGNSLDLQFHDRSNFSDQWFWQFGDGGTDYYTAHPYHNYSDTGKYNVTFINHIGHCSDTITKEVYANVLPSSVQITNSINTCSGTRGLVRFDQRSVRATGLTWNFGDGTIVPYDTSNHNVSHTYTASGVYQVTLTGTYNNCVLTSTRSVNVLLKQSPVFTGNISQLCASSSMEVKISNLQPNTFTGNWEYGQYSIDKFQYNTGAQFTGSYPAYAWSYTNYTGNLNGFTAGTTSMRVIILNQYSNCYDTSNYIPLQVNGPITGFKIQNNNLCFKSPFVFTDTSRSTTNVGLTTWQWNFGDGNIITRTNSSVEQHIYSNPGSYQVRLTVTDAVGCSGTFVSTINAKGPKAAFTASGLYVPNVPLNTNVSFYNYTNTWNNNTVNYTWHYGAGATSTNYSGSHTYTQAGTNTVMLIASDPSIPCTDTAKQVITVKDFNTAFSFTSTFLGTSSCLPVLVRINNLSVGFTNLVWDFGDGTRTTSSYYPSHIYNSPGKYLITLYTYGYNGLTGTYADSIEIKPLSATISADILKACLAQTVKLTATTQNAMSYSWDFGDGVVSPGTTPVTHPYNNAGSYTPRLIVKDQNGCATSATLPEKIVIDSLHIAIKGIPTLVCDSALVNFTPDVVSYAANKLGTALIYKWDFGTGNAADTSNIKNPSFRYSAPGNYTVKFRVESPYGCIKETTATIVVNQRAKGNINAVSQLCQDETIQFTGTASPVDNLQWKWNFANGNTSNLQTPPVQLYPTAGNYNVMMVVTRNGCVDSVIHPLIVHPKPVINALPRQHLLCLGSSVSLSSGGGATYTWTPATGLNNASIASPIASPATSTLYKVKVVTDKGCAQTDSVMINVAQPFNIHLAPTADLCKGSNIQLTASGASSYLWIGNTSGLSSTSIPNPVAKPSQNTSYTVVGSDANGCFKDTAIINITMRDLPTVNAGTDVEIPGGSPYQLSAVGSQDVSSWLWSPSVHLSCSNCPSPLATPKMQTAYVVHVKNIWGCSASDTMIIKIKCAVSNVFIPNSFTPDQDGKNDLFYIKGSGVNVIKHFRIYNRWGRVIFEKENFGIDDPAFAWDGRFNGIPAETGTYVYFA